MEALPGLLILGLIIIGIFLYFLPSFLGCKKRNAVTIFILNILVGWTLIGWLGALVWALIDEPPTSDNPSSNSQSLSQ